jgi:DNA-binding beta-propeller fold protein YncE
MARDRTAEIETNAYGAPTRKERERSSRSNAGVAVRRLLPFPLLSLVAACGSSKELPPAPEPAVSPPPDERPAGRVVRVGHKPEGLALDPRTELLAVGLTNPDRLALVNARSGRVERRVPLAESPRHLRLARAGGPVLVPAERANALVEVPLPQGPLRRTRVGRYPHDAVAADGRYFVADELADTMSVVRGGKTLRTLPAPTQPGGVAATTGGRSVGVVGVRERRLRIYDTDRLEEAGEVDVGSGPTHLVAGKKRFFVVDTRGDGLLEVRLRDEPVVHRRIHLSGAPYGIALDRVRSRIWVTLTARNELAELSDRRVIRRFPTVRQPNSVAVDERSGRVFVASRSDGTLQILDPPPS